MELVKFLSLMSKLIRQELTIKVQKKSLSEYRRSYQWNRENIITEVYVRLSEKLKKDVWSGPNPKIYGQDKGQVYQKRNDLREKRIGKKRDSKKLKE